jgi:predicted lysophospholipase L1 biosynthesis ABC-type transport system permease subunit
MAGDRTLRSSREVPAEWIAHARQSGLSVSEQPFLHPIAYRPQGQHAGHGEA